MPMGELLYETADIAYDTVTKNYVNPVTNSIYGASPPAGGWGINWYQDPVNGVPITVVGGTQTTGQIAAQLASTQPVNTTGVVAPVASTSFLDGTTFGVSNMLLLGGVVVALFLMSKK
jgi:hypothetical protein